jgi:hypothetical protein
LVDGKPSMSVFAVRMTLKKLVNAEPPTKPPGSGAATRISVT